MAWATKAKRQAYDEQRRQFNLLSKQSDTLIITGVDKIERRLEALARWSIEAENQIVALNRRVGEVYNTWLRANIKDFPRDIVIQRKDRPGRGEVIRPGTLRRSVGSYQPAPPNPRILSGPLTNNIGRRKRGVTKKADGWFAHIVEGGDSFGIKKKTVNTGVFNRGKRATQQRAMKLRDRLLQKEFGRYVGNLIRK